MVTSIDDACTYPRILSCCRVLVGKVGWEGGELEAGHPGVDHHATCFGVPGLWPCDETSSMVFAYIAYDGLPLSL